MWLGRLVAGLAFLALRCAAPGPRQYVTAVAARVQPATQLRYRRAALPFVQWLEQEELTPRRAAEWGDPVVESAVTHSLRHTDLDTLVAGIAVLVQAK